MNPILIICNGKSTNQLNWDWLKFNKNKIDTFAMNGAYKIFEKLNFYPDYYSNLDGVVLESHKHKIKKLINEEKIKKIFLNSSCDFDFGSSSKIYKINKIKNSFDCNLSETFDSFNSFMNTGCDSVQISIMMGYKIIYLIGVDGYLEIIDGVRKKEGIIYEVIETPKENPNYWFSSYQEKGEFYNLPNASYAHQPSWERIFEICKKKKIKLLNLSNNDYTNITKIRFLDFTKKIEEKI